VFDDGGLRPLLPAYSPTHYTHSDSHQGVGLTFVGGGDVNGYGFIDKVLSRAILLKSCKFNRQKQAGLSVRQLFG
jgi:hypothetical protein